MAKVKTLPTGQVSCSNGVLTVTNAQESIIYWTAATEYDMDKGTATSGYSFKGSDPHAVVSARIRRVSSDSYSGFYSAHITDVRTTLQRFTLDIGQKSDYTCTTEELVENYTQAQGNVLLEWLLFQYGRYLLFSSARGIVPSNLQGVWARDSGTAWSGGTWIYHPHLRYCTALQQTIIQTSIFNKHTGPQKAPISMLHRRFGTICRSHIKYQIWCVLANGISRKPGCHAELRLRKSCIIQPGDG